MMRKLILPLALSGMSLLAGCGFTPMHATSAVNGTKIADISVQLEKGKTVTDDQAGFFILQRLRDRIGEPSAISPYILELTPRYSRARLGITDNDVASRYDVTISASWKLINTKTGKTLDRGRTSAISTFGAPDGPYGVITADNVGVEQASKDTADKLVVALAKSLAASNKKKTK